MGGRRVTLPYDAEVEYLESTGTQYIDTGINRRSALHFALPIVIARSVSENSMIIGAYKDDSTVPKFQFFVRDTMKWGSINGASWNANTYTGFVVEGPVQTSQTYSITFDTKANASDWDIWLFARHNDRNAPLMFDGLRMYSLAITKSGESVADFQPVRVGSGAGAVGYLYDRVSGTLYGNAGTGNFTVGPDK
jgi:hypothetical protein